MRNYRIGKSVFGKTLFACRDFSPGELIFKGRGRLTRRATKYSYQVGWETHFEPSGAAKWVNHSCEPTMGLKIKAGQIPGFFALRAVKKGEELAADYGTFEYRTSVLNKKRCLCGSPRCREKITGFVGLDPAELGRFKGYIADYLLDKRNIATKSTKKHKTV